MKRFTVLIITCVTGALPNRLQIISLAIVTFGNGFYLSRQAEPALKAAGINVRIIDLRWLHPLPEETILEAIEEAKHVLVVDETRSTGGVAESLMTLLAERVQVPFARDVAADSFIATGPAYAATMPSVDSIVKAARALVGKS